MFFVVLEEILHPENRDAIVNRGDTIGPEDIAHMQSIGIDNFKVAVCLTESALDFTIESMSKE
jgi:hypothetical protein